MADPSSGAEDDWAPLAPEQPFLAPGAAEDAPAASRRAPPDEESERLLQELQQRVARAGAGESMVAALQRRSARTRRQQARARAAEDQLQGSFVAGAAPAAPPPQFEIDVRSDVDPREHEEWFLELPPPEQQRLREAWAAERHRFDWTGKAARVRVLRAAAYGAIMFTADAVLMILLTGDPWRFLVYAPAGALAGAVGQLIGGTRFHYCAAGALFFGLVEGPNLLANPFMLYGLLFAISTMALVGMDREMRASAGHRDD